MMIRYCDAQQPEHPEGDADARCDEQFEGPDARATRSSKARS